MNDTIAILGIVAAALVGFLLGKKAGGDRDRAGNADATFFQTTPGSGGFVQGRVLNRMKGRTFHWNRVGTKPAAGSRFEIRAKSGTLPLVPPIPSGTDSIFADANDSAVPGTVYKYSLWQVLANGSEKELHDPELEIGQV
jgi:hypothetical protein